VQGAALPLRQQRHGRSRAQLRQADAEGARFKLIATDGVFSMDGIIANLDAICDLAERYGAGDGRRLARGRLHRRDAARHAEHCGVMGRVDIITGTLGKALGGASGGYTSGRREIIDLLRQRSRPYLFSNTLAPPIVAASLKVLDLLEAATSCATAASQRAAVPRGMTAAGFTAAARGAPDHPGDAGRRARSRAAMAERLLARTASTSSASSSGGAEGQARIRTQIRRRTRATTSTAAVAAFTRWAASWE
jgi:glycine C-acetyltransferase